MVTFTTKRLDGRSVIAEFEDRGNTMPALSEDLAGVEVYTTMVRLECTEEAFNQTPADLLRLSPSPSQMRFSEDMAFMESLGLDPEFFPDDLSAAMQQKVGP